MKRSMLLTLGLAAVATLAALWAKPSSESGSRLPLRVAARDTQGRVAAQTSASVPHALAAVPWPGPTAFPAVDSRPAIPAAEQPLVQGIAALLARARSGDAAAARRLGEDLQLCALGMRSAGAGQDESPAPQLEAQWRLQRCATEHLCNGLTSAEVASRWDWRWRAAELGDPDARAMLAFGFAMWVDAPLEFAERLPQWRQHALPWMQGLVAAGHPEALFALARALGEPDERDAWPLAQLFDQDAESAASLLHALSLAPINAAQARVRSALESELRRLQVHLDPQARSRAEARGRQLFRQLHGALTQRALETGRLYGLQLDVRSLAHRFPQCAGQTAK